LKIREKILSDFLAIDIVKNKHRDTVRRRLTISNNAFDWLLLIAFFFNKMRISPPGVPRVMNGE
jgi:hypothetical protein